MKILLTGPTGFIGSSFLRQALAHGHQIAGLLRPGKSHPGDLPAGKNLVWLPGTLEASPWNEIAAFAADICVHTAWITTPGVYLESPENFAFLESSRQFLRQVRELGTGHIVGLGTCIEYQISGGKLSEEHTPVAPATTYARCKNELRLALQANARTAGGGFSWARVFYPYGPGEHPSRLCSSIMTKLSRDEKVVLKTPGSTKDYIYIDDLGAALLAVVEKKFNGEVNLGTGTGTSVREIAQTLAGLMKKPHLIEELNPPEVDPLGNVVADAARLHELGWRPGHTLAEGLQKLLAPRR